jgi:dihydrofolate reductase
MGKLVSFMHVSLDGFTARLNGEMDWIRMDEAIFDLAVAQTEKSDTALYGRNTHEIMKAYWPTAANNPQISRQDLSHSIWYNQVNKIVVSKTMRGQSFEKTIIVSENVPAAIAALKKRTVGEIIMFGSPSLTGSLIQENLIDEYWIFINPVILGQGISLYSKNQQELTLHLVDHIPFSNGVVCLHYAQN